MKKIAFFMTLGIFFIPFFVSAHPGNTDSYGCHTCRTNCSSWGLSYGEYHCHQSKGLPQPSYPISSQWGSNGTGTTYPNPDYAYSYPTIPSCPSNSSYSYLNDACQCNYGYVIGTDFLGKEACVSGDSYCRDKYGLWSSYDSLSKKCECDYGYIFGEDIFGDLQCIDGDNYCEDLMGPHAYYYSLSNSCRCDAGYSLSGNECMSNDGNGLSYAEYLRLLDLYSSGNSSNNLCPKNSSLGSDGSCYCDSGYVVNGTKDGCIFETLCGPNSRLIGSQCECYPGYHRTDNSGAGCELYIAPQKKTASNNLSDNPLSLMSDMLIKNKEYVEVFWVDEDLCLRWVTNETVAEKNFGLTWNYEGNIKEFDTIPLGYKFCDKLE